MLFNRSPSIDHLRIIGSKCYTNKTGKQLGKLDERATECLLVGYESENIYRVYEPSSRKVFRSRDVVIQEITQPKERRHVSNPDMIPPVDHNVVHIQSDITDHNVQPHIPPSPISPIEELEQSPSLNQYHTAISYPNVEPETTNDSSLDELADPQYDKDWNAYKDPYFPRAFVNRCFAAADSIGEYLPETLEQAIRCDNAKQWSESMRDEMKSIVENETWKLTPAPKEAKIIQGRWVFRTKTDVNGKIIKYKSRWVVRGFQ